MLRHGHLAFVDLKTRRQFPDIRHRERDPIKRSLGGMDRGSHLLATLIDAHKPLFLGSSF